jgi:hypothetical protein
VLNRVEVHRSGGNGIIAAGSTNGLSLSITDSTVSNTLNVGLNAFQAAFVMVRNSTVSHNGTGLLANGPGTLVLVTRSVIIGNGNAITTVNNGAVNSYGDNNLNGNTNDGAFTTNFPLH